MASTDMSAMSTETDLWLWIRVAMIATIVTVIVRLKLLQSLLRFVRVRLWTQWMVMKQMRKQGHSGPSFGLFRNNRQDMMKLRMKAPNDPLYSSAGMNHDIMPRVFAPQQTWTDRYGDKFIYADEGSSKVMMYTTDAEAAKEILSNKFYQYAKPALPLFSRLVGSKGIILQEFEEWARQRKVVRPAFYPERNKRLVPDIALWTESWLQQLDKNVADNEGSFETDMFVEFNDLNRDILARSSFGSSFEKASKGFQHLMKHLELMLQERTISNPLIRWIGGPPSLKKAIRTEQEGVSKCLREIIQERRKSIQPENGESYGQDLLGVLLADRDRRLAEDGRPPGELETEDEFLMDQCRSFFFGGSDTIQIAMSWTTVLLAHYTDWQERIRAEVHEVFGSAPPTEDQLAKLKQLEMFVQEALRLYSPAPVTLREVVKPNTTLLGEPVPQHLLIMINFLGLHREKEYWGEDALEFKPERFANGILQACKSKPYVRCTFGFGPRTCVGQDLALTAVKVVMVKLVQCFSIRLSPTYRHEPEWRLHLVPKFGVQVVLQRIRPAK